ncbi:MAG: polyribonucleotide nucleotidyltransferase [Candidatus Marinimicrobia bacterium]|nr:polyribonucleotide nucleotidyltransferase [Candidatus Neomarinimicrobiota bacterium]MCF7880630.1 polyribonucleotide nucleotidyltransferase [Candidatus Neomarinimicrobiota bacterium]
MSISQKSIELAGRTLTIETGKMARQADGAVTVTYGDTVILATAVSEHEPTDFPYFPLMVDYREKGYAAGKVPGGFFKREGRPSDHEILSARLTDRPIRPLFPDGYMYDTQVMIAVISSDQENLADVLGTVGASAALTVSDIPFDGPIASVRVGRVDDEFRINPQLEDLEESDVNLIVAGNKESIMMVEGDAAEISEDEFIDALKAGHEAIKQLIQLQEDLAAELGVTKREFEVVKIDDEFRSKVEDAVPQEKIVEINSNTNKQERTQLRSELKESVKAQLEEEYPDQIGDVGDIIGNMLKTDVRERILESKVRIDGRKPTDIRDVSCEVGLLPRSHGSALFTRGETQSLTGVTLGTKMDEQQIDDLTQEYSKSFMLHYNFPPFSVGEVKPIRGVSRRETGHGHLAERSFKSVIPNAEEFAYTVRVVSDILESNGSSSMATVCAGSLAMMDAGVPIKAQVSGIAMGLVKDGDRYTVLSDILGEEDHYGDMDFKVAGTADGITAIQMDLKISGISFELMREALEQAKDGRGHIRDIMDKAIAEPRSQTSEYAPKIVSYKIPQDMIGQLIGPGGKNVKKIQEETGANIEIDDDGTVFISAESRDAGDTAMQMAQRYTAKPEEGKVYDGLVKRIENYGAFVEILPGKEGLLHISNIQDKRTENVTDILSVGDTVKVKLLKIDDRGRYDLSRKDVTDEEK